MGVVGAGGTAWRAVGAMRDRGVDGSTVRWTTRPRRELSTSLGTLSGDPDHDTIFHSPHDTQPLVVRPPTLTAPATDSVIHTVPVPVTLRVTCAAAG